MNKKKGKWRVIIIVLVVLFLISFFITGILSLFISADFEAMAGNVALIPVKGLITADNIDGFVVDSVSSTEIISMLEKAEKNPNVKAILLEINSPGGSAVASEEVARKLKSINKTKVAWIREAGVSGAYWVASASEHIVASRMSVTGSIGVLSSYLDFSGFLENHSITYQRLVAGEYKDIGSPLKELTPSERYKIQEKINKIHEYFIEDVAKNRELSVDKVKTFSDGMFYLGSEAKEMGLIDEIGGKEEALNYISKKLGIKVQVSEYKMEKGFLDMLKKLVSEQSFFLGRGIGASLFGEAENRINIVT